MSLKYQNPTNTTQNTPNRNNAPSPLNVAFGPINSHMEITHTAKANPTTPRIAVNMVAP